MTRFRGGRCGHRAGSSRTSGFLARKTLPVTERQVYYVGPNPPALRAGRVLATRGCDALWSTERAHTPPEFAAVLIGMARSAARVAA